MHEIPLEGCAPIPLAGYLKALGVLRLLSQKDPDLRGCWRNGAFVLVTRLEGDSIEDFFLHEYAPTPVLAPWNGGSGFYEKDNKAALEAIIASPDPRFSLYRRCLDIAEKTLAGRDRRASPKGDDKIALQLLLRARIPDEALPWFDAAVSLTGDRVRYPPLLGTGGNDGRLDFTNNFMQRLIDVVVPGSEGAGANTGPWLAMALFAQPAPGLIKSAIGQFSPGQVGGPNSTTGFDADSVINPWDFVLMIEGALTFAAAVVRRHADEPGGILSYPFTVKSVSAGSGAVGEGDADNARGEVWMPLWSAPATYREIRALMAEGRVALGRKPAGDGLDFVRAVHHLGSYRGIDGFQRFGLLMRSGKAYLATPLGRVAVSRDPQSRYLDDLDDNAWLERFRSFARGKNTANRFRILRRQLVDLLFDLSGREALAVDIQAVLVLLGEIQSALAHSAKARETVPPVPRLSQSWVLAADDGTPAFRIARALAGLRGVGDQPLPLRAQLFPVQRRGCRWMNPDAREDVRIHSDCRGSLTEVLISLLDRRLWLTERLRLADKPFASSAGTTVDDVLVFLRDERMDARILALLPGLALCEIPEEDDHATASREQLPAAFGLLKLVLTPDRALHRLGKLAEHDRIPIPTGMLARLVAGNHGNRAVQIAWRRLRASGASPTFSTGDLPEPLGIAPRRAAAALLVPLCFRATAQLAQRLLQASEIEADAL